MEITTAVMSGNTVTNIIVVDSIQQSSNELGVTLIEYTPENPAGIGYTYDDTTGKFNAPFVEEVTE